MFGESDSSGPEQVPTPCSGGGQPNGDAVLVLCRLLGEGNDLVRGAAAQALGRIADHRAVEALVSALLDEDEDVRADVAEALAQIKDRRADTQLMENLLADPSGEVKLNAVDALTATGAGELVPWLRRIVKGRDPEIVWGDQDFIESGWDDWLDLQVKAIASLGALRAEEAVDDIVSAIDEEESQDLTEVGFAALARMGDAGLSALGGYLDSGQPRVRRRVAALLAGSEAAGARPFMEQALSDPVASVRLAALNALFMRAPLDPLLVPALSDPDPDIRAFAAGHYDLREPEHVLALLADAGPKVRVAMLEALAKEEPAATDKAVVDRVHKLLKAKPNDVAAAAAVAYARLAGPGAIAELSEIAAASQEPDTLRLAALKGVVAIGDEKIVPLLAELPGVNRRGLRIAAMTALARFAGDQAWPNAAGAVLLAALRGELVPTPEEESGTAVSQEAAKAEAAGAEGATDEFPDEDNVEEPDGVFPVATLDAMLGAQSAEAQVLRRRSQVAGLSPSDLDFLAVAKKRAMRKRVIALAEPVPAHQDVRRLAARLLGDVVDAEVFGALADCLEDPDEEVRHGAAESLARMAPRLDPLPRSACERICARMMEGDPAVRLNAVRVAACMPGEMADANLLACLGDEVAAVRIESIRSLAARKAGAGELTALLRDGEPDIALAAALALPALAGPGCCGEIVDFALASDGCGHRELARTLTKINAAETKARLLSALSDPDLERVWPIAIDMIGEMNG